MLDAAETVVVPVGPDAVAALVEAVGRAQRDDVFARVVVIADHFDAARSIRHRLGRTGMINVTVQTGGRLAGELAQTPLKPLSRVLESQAVRQVAENYAADFTAAGKQRFYRSLGDAFRQMADRRATAGGGADGMNAMAEALYPEYRDRVTDRGYYLPANLPRLAASAVSGLIDAARLPAVIYYLPRRMSEGDIELAQALRAKGKAQIIAGRTDDADADAPVAELLGRLDGSFAAFNNDAAPPNPLRRRARDGGLSLISAPDPEEEVRAVIRRIAAGDTPLHRIAVVFRQDNPYAALLRQELDFAGIPYSGAEYRSLGDTPTGRRLAGFALMAAAADGGIDRERLIEWLSAAPLRDPAHRNRPIPATDWAEMARQARAGGPPAQWRTRLNAYIAQQESRSLERDGELSDWVVRRKGQAEALHRFVAELSTRLSELAGPRMDWGIAADQLAAMLNDYQWHTMDDSAAESADDRRRIGELVESLAGLADWGVDYRAETLLEALGDGLRSPVSPRGRPVGAGVYLGPPPGIAGADYDAVYAVGMAERQFPPSPRANPWLADDADELRRDARLERYDFLAAIAAAGSAVLCWPAATGERRFAYPSRWLVEAANYLHETHGGAGRLNYETINRGDGHEHWLTVIESRQAGLKSVTESSAMDDADYRLMHLNAQPARLYDAGLSDARMRRALAARAARNGAALTEWDGLVGGESARIAGIGQPDRPISPSALETWATCPYRYFLSRILRIAAPPDDDADELAALDRGSMVHKILERFIKESDGAAKEKLLELAEQEFDAAEKSGITGRYLLWEMEKETIRTGLSNFLEADARWLDGTPDKSEAEVGFDYVTVDVADLGEVTFRGKIDRLDVIGDEVRVRDFKTGNSTTSTNHYTRDTPSYNPYTIANGRALQLPVYVAAARREYPDNEITGSFCFPLADKPIHGARKYDDGQQDDFHTALRNILGAARSGIFPATPDGEGQGSNCNWCDFNNLCPTRRRQIWERKGRNDDKAQPFNQLGGKAAIGDGNDNAS